MEVLLLLFGISLLISVGFLIVFIWNVKSGQYDDTYGPSQKILFDNIEIKKQKNKNL